MEKQLVTSRWMVVIISIFGLIVGIHFQCVMLAATSNALLIITIIAAMGGYE